MSGALASEGHDDESLTSACWDCSEGMVQFKVHLKSQNPTETNGFMQLYAIYTCDLRSIIKVGQKDMDPIKGSRDVNIVPV